MFNAFFDGLFDAYNRYPNLIINFVQSVQIVQHNGKNYQYIGIYPEDNQLVQIFVAVIVEPLTDIRKPHKLKVKRRKGQPKTPDNDSLLIGKASDSAASPETKKIENSIPFDTTPLNIPLSPSKEELKNDSNNTPTNCLLTPLYLSESMNLQVLYEASENDLVRKKIKSNLEVPFDCLEIASASKEISKSEVRRFLLTTFECVKDLTNMIGEGNYSQARDYYENLEEIKKNYLTQFLKDDINTLPKVTPAEIFAVYCDKELSLIMDNVLKSNLVDEIDRGRCLTIKTGIENINLEKTST